MKKDDCIGLKIYRDNLDRLQDIMEIFSSGNVQSALEEIGIKFSGLANCLAENRIQDKKHMVLRNLLLASIPYLKLSAEHQDGFVQILAICLRNIFEIHLWSRYVQISEDHLQTWCLEAQTDKIKMFDFLKQLTTAGSFEKEADLIGQQEAHIKILVEKNNTQVPKGNLLVSDIAKALDKKFEYDVFYKMASKFTHATSFLVNSSDEEIQQYGLRKTFLMHILLYGWDIHDHIESQIFF